MGMAGPGLLPKHVQDVSVVGLGYDAEPKPSLKFKAKLGRWMK